MINKVALETNITANALIRTVFVDFQPNYAIAEKSGLKCNI